MGKNQRMDVRLKRAYEPAASADGYRVLIDRLWPRGVSRERAKLDGSKKDLPPSTELREWFGHDPSRLRSFADATSRSSAASVHGSRPCDGGRAMGRSRSSTPPTTSSTTTLSSSRRSYGVASRRVKAGADDDCNPRRISIRRRALAAGAPLAWIHRVDGLVPSGGVSLVTS